MQDSQLGDLEANGGGMSLVPDDMQDNEWNRNPEAVGGNLRLPCSDA